MRVLRTFAGIAGARPWHYWVPTSMALLAAALEGASLALLVPLAKGLANDDFGFVWRAPGIRAWQASILDLFGATQSPNRAGFLVLVSALFLASVAGLAVAYLGARVCAWRNGVYAAKVRSRTLERCLTFGKLYFDRMPQATISETIGYSESVLRVLTLFETAVNQAFRLIAQVVVMITISWPLTVLLFLALPVLRAVDRRIVRRSRSAAEGATRATLELRKGLYNTLSCIPLVKAHGLEEQTYRTYTSLVDRNRRLTFARDAAALAVAPLQQVVALCALLVIVWVAVVTTTTDHTSGLSVICAFLLITRRSVPMLGVVSTLRVGLAKERPFLDRLAELFVDDGKYFVASGTREFRGLKTGIELRNLSFSYAEGTPVLRGLSAVASAGCTTALVGETGCGKTTVASLITRLYECPPGSIFLDGVDIREYSRESLARRTAYVGQEAWLFNDSLRANLVVGLDRTVSDDELREALDRVGLVSLVSRDASGLDVEIGDRGVTLSGGEKQRLCIARALLRRSDLLVLDEATASLDSHTEREIQHVVERATRGRTAIVIAHRLSTVRHADKILVLARGQVVEEGTWAQLVHAGGLFASMWEAQTRAAVPGHATSHPEVLERVSDSV